MSCAQVDELRARSLEGVTAELAAGATQAVSTLIELLGSDTPPTVRVAAARALLTNTLQYHDAAEIQNQIREVQRTLYVTPDGETGS